MSIATRAHRRGSAAQPGLHAVWSHRLAHAITGGKSGEHVHGRMPETLDRCLASPRPSAGVTSTISTDPPSWPVINERGTGALRSGTWLEWGYLVWLVVLDRTLMGMVTDGATGGAERVARGCVVGSSCS